jgi:hypothetical protein
MAGLLAYSFFERLPVNGEWKKYKAIFSPYSLNSGKSIVQKNQKEFTAAGLQPIFTAFPFHQFT